MIYHRILVTAGIFSINLTCSVMSQGVKCSLNMVVGKRIKYLRQKNNWHQPMVAWRLGISVSSYSKIEAGFTDLNFSRLVQIAEIFQVPVTELLSENALQEIQQGNIDRLIKKRLVESDQEIARLNEKINILEKLIKQVPQKPSVHGNS